VFIFPLRKNFVRGGVDLSLQRPNCSTNANSIKPATTKNKLANKYMPKAVNFPDDGLSA